MTDHAIILRCAELAHEANRIYCKATGDASQVPWAQAPEWQRASAIRGVRTALDGATPEQQHDAWSADKIANGWVRSDVKDADAKTHPCLVPYAALPAMQRRKDSLYIAVVRAMADALDGVRTREVITAADVGSLDDVLGPTLR